MSQSWKEVQVAQAEKRCELVFSGSPYSERIEKEGLDSALFSLKHLNFLEISKTCLKDLPSALGELSNLTRMVICCNSIRSLPPEIANLKKLKFLDVSHNALTELPSQLSELSEMQSLNVSSNELATLPQITEMTKLVTLNISYNKFSALPLGICDARLIHFTDLLANNNSITDIPPEIQVLNSLKVLDLSENKILSIPGELGSCTKLKELNLKGNALKDKRLLKLVEQCHVKQVMDYIRSHCPKSVDNKQSKPKKKGKQSKRNDVDEITDILDELKITHLLEDSIKVICSSKVADIRPYVVCCKVSDISFSDGNLLKKFITLQTKLHDTVCDKRTSATIATHDFSKIQGDLLYDARPPEEILVTPLNRKKELTAAELYTQLNEEADAIRKEKKKNTYSGIHKYLYLLKEKPLYPCLIDTSNNKVISFPPITNSEGTKISTETKDMLLEVTGYNLNTCKKVMDTLLIDILKLGIGNKVSQDDEEVSKNVLTVQQMKIVDEEGKLKVVYPSRTDVCSEGISVIRS